ncbi:hypothetical protein HHO41_06095 [Bacillus sp. DNRA2]|uniref:hypothetical protein n=1 Tax=Bacillus sp. DNRA2 TaxID=2723053 RepID=UPI00145E9721|nr:hypothetical protein [Bacillus sp. DNRA2]NMD69852.1 hypothetical protein [Bacillus sp. DNRA2]
MDKKWVKTVNNMSKNINWFGQKKRTNKGIFWASLLGLGASAAAYQMGKSQKQNKSDRLQSLMDNFQKTRNISLPNLAMAEFAKELTPDKKTATNVDHTKNTENFSETIPAEDPLSNNQEHLS